MIKKLDIKDFAIIDDINIAIGRAKGINLAEA